MPPSYLHAALVIVGHGSTVNPDSSAPTLDLVTELRRRRIFAEVQAAFWKEEPSLRQVLHTLDSREVFVVPNFISEGYFTRTVIPRELELAGPLTVRDGQTIKYCDPVGSHPGVTDLLLRRAREVAPGVPPAKTTLIIVGHGTDLNDNSAAAAKREVEQIAARGIYAQVLNAYMEEAPLVAEWDRLSTQPNVVVVPFFIADGLHSYQDIPVLLGLETETGPAASQSAIFRRNPVQLRGRNLFYASAIGTEPRFAELILDQVAAFERQHAPGEIAPASEPREGMMAALLETLLAKEAAQMGEIAILRNGAGFELSHVDEAGIPNLELFTAVEDARMLAAYDAQGAFRPLKTAPDLRRGWQLQLTSPAELQTALEYFYPAMLGVRRDHLAGRLPDVPLRSTLGRQSGMYAVTRKISDEQADVLIGQFCQSETGCLKKILWPIAPERPITTLPAEKFQAEPAPGQFPLLCQEPCNLLVAKVREVVKGSVPAQPGSHAADESCPQVA